jgi:spore coat protein U-like protein
MAGLSTRLGLLIAFALTFCCVATPAAAVISCTTTITNVNFGTTVNVLPGTPIDVNATQTITCTGATANSTYRFCTDIRSGTDVSGNQRRMASGANRLNFDLYKDPSHSVQWGHFTTLFLGGGSQNDFTSNGAGAISATVTVFARLAGSQQTAIPAAYTESMNSGTTNDMQYGSLASAGACPIGGSTATFSFTVSATVVKNCNVSTTPLDFLSTLNLASAVNATSTITTTCTSGTTYTVGLSAGNGTGATTAVRKMTFGANTINYSIYTNAAHTTVWGAGTVSGTGTGNAQPPVTAFGQVPAQALPNPGTYTDTIVATVTF